MNAVAYNEIRGRLVELGEHGRDMLGEPGDEVLPVWVEVDWSLFE